MSQTTLSAHDLRKAAGVVLLTHIVNSTLHGIVHQRIPVHVTDWQQLGALLVIFTGPIAGYLMMRRDHVRWGTLVYGSSFALAFVFSVTNHFVILNPDHLAAVPADSLQVYFEVTAALEVGLEAAGTAVGALTYAMVRREGRYKTEAHVGQ